MKEIVNMEERKYGVRKWIKEHKTEIIIGSLIITGAGLVIGLGIACSNSEPAMYSTEWIRRLSPQEWETQREIVRKRYCVSGRTGEYGWQDILWRFDQVKREQEPPVRGPIYPYQREHGWNLYKPD